MVCINLDEIAGDMVSAAALCHEATHIFQRMCDSIGETNPSREFMAYSIESITEQLLREYVRRTGLTTKAQEE